MPTRQRFFGTPNFRREYGNVTMISPSAPSRLSSSMSVIALETVAEEVGAEHARRAVRDAS